MKATADPWEPPCSPSLLHDAVRRPEVTFLDGPGRVYDESAADLTWRPRHVGFAPPARAEVDPLLWDGDDS